MALFWQHVGGHFLKKIRCKKHQRLISNFSLKKLKLVTCVSRVVMHNRPLVMHRPWILPFHSETTRCTIVVWMLMKATVKRRIYLLKINVIFVTKFWPFCTMLGQKLLFSSIIYIYTGPYLIITNSIFLVVYEGFWSVLMKCIFINYLIFLNWLSCFYIFTLRYFNQQYLTISFKWWLCVFINNKTSKSLYYDKTDSKCID